MRNLVSATALLATVGAALGLSACQTLGTSGAPDLSFAAEAARVEYNRALHYLTPATQGWTTRAYTCSASEGIGVAALWDVVEAFAATTKESGVFDTRRRQQNSEWLHLLVDEQLRAYVYAHPAVKAILPQIEAAVVQGTLPATAAANRLLQAVLVDEETS